VLSTKVVVVCEPRGVQIVQIVATHLVRHSLRFVQLVQTLTICLVLHRMKQLLWPITSRPVTYLATQTAAAAALCVTDRAGVQLTGRMDFEPLGKTATRSSGQTFNGSSTS